MGLGHDIAELLSLKYSDKDERFGGTQESRKKKKRINNGEPQIMVAGDPQRVQDYESSLKAIRALIMTCLDERQKRVIMRGRSSAPGSQELFKYFVEQWQLEKWGYTDETPRNNIAIGEQRPYRQGTNEQPRSLEGGTVFLDDGELQFGDEDLDRSDLAELRSIIRELQERLRVSTQARVHDAQDWDIKERGLHAQIQSSTLRATNAEDQLNKRNFAHRQEVDELRSNVHQWKHYHDSTMQTTKLNHQAAVNDAVKKARIEVETHFDGVILNERNVYDHKIRSKNGEIEARDKKIQQFKDQLVTERTEHQLILDEREQTHRDDAAHLKSTLMAEIQEQKDRYELELQEVTTEAAKQQSDLESQMAQQKQSYENEITSLRIEHAQAIHKMEQDHAEDLVNATRESKQKITALNAMLFARADFTPVPDRLLKEKFLSLRHDVQYLARQSWRPDQSFWTTAVLMEITSNPDKVREQLLRDEIWWILNDHVFASPFRMFGDEARSLESQWNSGCGRGRQSILA
jgi:hypothetical protein